MYWNGCPLPRNSVRQAPPASETRSRSIIDSPMRASTRHNGAFSSRDKVGCDIRSRLLSGSGPQATAADVQDSDGGLELLATLFGLFPFLGKLFADSAIKGRSFTVSWPASCPTSKPRSSSDPIGSRASSSSPGVGWSNAPSLAQPLTPIGQGLGKPQP